MTANEYFLFALKEKLCNNIKWYYRLMTPSMENQDNEYYASSSDKIFIKINDEMFEITDRKPGDIIVDFKSTINLSNNDLPNIEETVETTIGRAIVNYLLIAKPFNNKIKYINKSFSSKNIESIVSDYLFREIITVDEYINFVNNCSFIQPLTKIFIDVATVKNTTKPEGIEEYKKELSDKFDSEYGENWKDDPVLSGNFSEKLQEFDTAYLQDDPTLGKLLTNKIKNNARTKMYLAVGSEKGFDGRTPIVESSLIDGFPKDNTQLSYIFNGGRVGSFDRGHETQKGGASAKVLLRVAGSVKIVDGDCGSKVLKETIITKENASSLVGCYCHFGDHNLIPLMKPDDHIGKKVWIRTPLFCKLEGKKFCAVCVGKTLSSRKDGVNLLFTTVSTPILTASLKGMHNSQITTVNVSLIDNVK